MPIINAHAHLLPYPHQIPLFMKEKEVFWIKEDMSCMCQYQWQRPITDRSFFLNEKLEWMDDHKIDKEVLLNLSQLYCNGYERTLCHDVIRFQNDFNAEVQSLHPDRFYSGFVVQPRYIDDAVAEIQRCTSQYGLKLLCLPSHYLNTEDKWSSIADKNTEPIFAIADELGLAVEIHPYNAEQMISLEDKYWRFHLIWMCAQTADTYHFYTLLGFDKKYPNVRTCFAHGNLFGQIGYGRRLRGYNGRPDLFIHTSSPEESLQAHNIYFDSIVHDALALDMMVQRTGVSQILFGLDDPYPLGEMDADDGTYPGRILDEGVRLGFITAEEKAAICYDNIITWLGV